MEAETHREKNKSKIIPKYFYRTSYETSITLSGYTSKDTHAKHREQPELRITKGNAFQAICPFTITSDMTRERIERHLIWNKKRDPSSYVSAFNKLCKSSRGTPVANQLTVSAHAVRRAGFHYKQSQRIGHRVFIAQIDTEGFVAATISAKCRTTVDIITKRRLNSDLVESSYHFFDVDIPVWIRDPRRPEDRTDLTVEELTTLGTDMWTSISELRESNLKNGPKSRVKYSRDCICSKGHSYEWLACGVIPKSCIVRVMPYDGKVLYKSRTTQIIRSLDSSQPWVWSWDKEMWVLDSALTAIAEWRDVEAHQAREARKRIAEDEGISIDQEKPAKRAKLIELTIIRPYINFSTVRQYTTSAM
jgi:hypothetical protein